MIKKYETEIVIENQNKNSRHYSLLDTISKQLLEFKGQLLPKSYANAVASDPYSTEEKPYQHIVIIKPKDTKITSTETEKWLKTAVDPQKLKIGIKRKKQISNGGVIIECRNDSECDKLVAEIGTKVSEVTVGKPLKRNPKLVLKDVNIQINETELIEKIIKNNEDIKNYLIGKSDTEIASELNLKFKFRNKNNNKYNMYCLEVSPELRKIVMKTKRIFIDWNSCRVEDSLPIIRCFKCNGFGHKSDVCSLADSRKSEMFKKISLKYEIK
jgi:hypothetical protein